MKMFKTAPPQVSAWDPTRLSELQSGSADILVLERQNILDLVDAVRDVPIAEFRARVTERNAASQIARGVRDLQLAETSLAEDITSLTESFLIGFERPSVSLRIEIVDTQSCPKFHCDNVFVRLVTTYLGPCTEYQYVGEETIYTAGLGSLVFLKGHKHPTHRDTVHHRSPAVAQGTKRLCVVVDF
ncbi:MAG: DUF1826 domain-containing protein [Planctomycetaceae bacterium]|nr:DUF1826 domain-containing protein [Planctomycetaceae bacterium]